MAGKKGGRGFTLVELLIVVVLIGIVSGVVVAIYNGAVKDSAETVSIAVQKQLTNTVNNYLALHNNRLPDGFDSLIRVAPGGGFTGTFTNCGTAMSPLLVADDPKGFFYVGYDVNPADNVADDTANSKGLNTWGYLGAFRSLTVAQLTASDVATLKQLGITSVYDINTNADFFHGAVSYTKRTLAAGQPVCILDPRTCRNGISIYGGFGVDLADTATYTRATASGGSTDYPIMPNDLDDNGRNKALQRQRFLVLGIGPNCKWIGDRRGGVVESPECPIVNDGEYTRYLLVIKMPSGPNDMNPALAGVLDATGKDVRGARSWATRTE